MRRPASLATLRLLALLSSLLPSDPSFARPAPEESADFLRFVPVGKDAGRLETAIVTLWGPKGAVVDLVAAVHIADHAYYELLDRRFKGYDALLYEMVKPAQVAPASTEKSQSGLSTFQRWLKDVLALEFQLDAIDYTRGNFVHADMDSATFSRLSRERGENLVTLMFRAVLDDLRRQLEGEETPEVSALDLLKVFLSKDRSRSLKLLLAKQFKDLEARMEGLGGAEGTVILTERNKVAVSVVEKTLASGKKRLGVFYGAAHMPDMERRLKDLGFSRKEVRWLTAWDLPPVKEEPPESRKKP